MTRYGFAGALLGAFALAAPAFAADTPPATVEGKVDKPVAFVDEAMKTRLFLLVDDYNRQTRTLNVERARYDDVVGVQCEWQGTAVVDSEDRITVDIKNHACAQQEIDPALDGGERIDMANRFGPRDVTVAFDAANNVITETGSTGRTELGVTSSYERAWNLDDGTVCITAQEGQFVPDGEDGETYNNYYEVDIGCYDFPDNEHVRDLIAKHAPGVSLP